MRIGLLQILQESNSFNPVRTELDEFEKFGIGLGPRVLERFADVDEIGGFVEGLREWPGGAEPVGIIRAQGWSSGPMSAKTRRWFIDAVREQLHQAGRLDAILFALHGSMVGEDDDTVDGSFLETVRAVVGPSVPVVATVDLHANLTRRVLSQADAVVPYHTAPHLDRRQTGARAARVLARILGGATPVCASVRLPMLAVSEAMVSTGPVLGPVFEHLRALEQRPDVLSAGVLMTQGWLDVPDLGWSTLAVTDAKPDLARELADELAEACWALREDLTCDYYSAKDSIDRALACGGKPVVIADGPDATNSGAPGDGTHLLRELIARDVPSGALTIMVDPDAVAHAIRAGEGGAFRMPVGGKRDNVFSDPLPVEGRVLSTGPAQYVLTGHGGDNLAVDMGQSAAVRVKDVTILFIEKTAPGGTPMMYRCVGLEPADFKIVIVKSPAGFRADFEPFAADIILSDCPGCASPHYDRLPYKRISRPLWPIDEIDDWRGVEWVRGVNEDLDHLGVAGRNT